MPDAERGGDGPAPRAPATAAQRRARRRRLVVLVHLWVGLTAGLVVSVVGLTGSLTVFAPELSAALAPGLLRVPPASRGLPPLDTREVVRRVEAATGAGVESVQWPLRGRETYWLKLVGREAWVFADPHTGAVLGTDRDAAPIRFFAWVLDVHTTLTMEEFGSRVTGAASLALALVLVSSGLFLWWPRGRRPLGTRLGQAARVRWRGATRRRRTFDLHNAGGAWASVPLVVLAVTGSYWSFPAAGQRLVDAVTQSAPSTAFPSTAEAEPRSTPRAGPDGRPLRPRSLGEVLAATDTLFPGHARRNLWMTGDRTGVVYLSWIREPRIAPGGEYRPMAWLDRYDARPLRVYDPARAPLGTRLTNVWLPPVHFGEVGGLPTRVLACAAGLVPAGLYGTGALLWRRRRRRGGTSRSRERRRTSQENGARA
jgi:uncharacterized iron-regulated membrane protein